MDKIQIDEILLRRSDGQSMGQISKNTGIPVSTVKSYFRRHRPEEKTKKAAPAEFCQQCGQGIKNQGRGKPKRFCSDKCRRAWWKANRELSGSQATLKLKCIYCGKTFGSYESRNRKYCSHDCFISDRFRKEKENE